MAYEHVTPQSHPDVLRHWEFFKKVLENTFRIGKLWEEYNVVLEPFIELHASEAHPSKYWLKAKYKDSSHHIVLEFLSNNSSMYFRTKRLNSLNFDYKKKGQATEGEEFNTALIFEVCDSLYFEFKDSYDRAVKIDLALQEKNIIFNNIIEQMKIESGSVLKGKAYKGIADLQIDCKDKNINRVQVYGTQRAGGFRFDLNLQDISPLKTARIAKILAEEEHEISPTHESDFKVMQDHWDVLKKSIEAEYASHSHAVSILFENESFENGAFNMNLVIKYKDICICLVVNLYLSRNLLQRRSDKLIFNIYKEQQDIQKKDLTGVIWRNGINENLIRISLNYLSEYLFRIDNAIYLDKK